MSDLKPVADPQFLSVFLTEELYPLGDSPAPEASVTAAKPEVSPDAPQPDQAPVSQAPLPPDLIFGENNKELLILVEDPANKVLSKTEGKLLKDILQSVGFSFSDVAILNIARCTEGHYWDCLKNINYRHVLSFGLRPLALPELSKLDNFAYHQQGEVCYILAEKLPVLQQEREAKIKLWNLLKALFV